MKSNWLTYTLVCNIYFTSKISIYSLPIFVPDPLSISITATISTTTITITTPSTSTTTTTTTTTTTINNQYAYYFVWSVWYWSCVRVSFVIIVTNLFSLSHLIPCIKNIIFNPLIIHSIREWTILLLTEFYFRKCCRLRYIIP